MNKQLVAFCLFGVLLSGQAIAADAIVDAPVAVAPPPPPSNWTGFYFGGHAGYVYDEATWTVAPASFWGNTGASADINSGGFLGGAQVGYMQQMPNNIVWGAEISASYTDIGDTIISPEFPDEDTWSVGVDWLLLAQARIGYAQDRFLFFVQGGYAGADASARGRSTDGPVDASVSNWHNGWTIGAGAAYKATENISFGAEYNYIDLGSETYDLRALVSPGNVNVDHQLHAIKLTLNWHFGG